MAILKIRIKLFLRMLINAEQFFKTLYLPALIGEIFAAILFLHMTTLSLSLDSSLNESKHLW